MITEKNIIGKDKRVVLIDALVPIICIYVAFLIKYDFKIPPQTYELISSWIPIFVISQVVVFYFSKLHARIWRYTSIHDLYTILISVSLSTGIAFLAILFLVLESPFPRSILILYYFFNTILTLGLRIIVRTYYNLYAEGPISNKDKHKKRLMIIGAGKAGDKIAREILTTSRNDYSIAGYIDDHPDKQGALLHGKKVFCKIKELPQLDQDYDELLITIRPSSGEQMRKIVDYCKQTGKKYKTLPPLNELIDREVTLDAVRDVNYSDLLGRQEVDLDKKSIESIISGKRVLITGAGGSIGSELVRQCLSFNPGEIICLDFNEEKIYDIDQITSNIKTNTKIKSVLASVINLDQLRKVFDENRPHIVIHAAAYKHVPIQELHPWTAVDTNVEGTMNLVELSGNFSVDRFVLVSTDKAVNPVNIMGATKRVSEKIIQSYNKDSKTTFMAVRFGNVLGSSGSAIPTFQEQIKKGGPITITHPEMTRYFMSIHEASQLILQCSALGRDADIFLLEMGRPIKIVQMAKDLIKLSGLEPEIDIPIVYSGLRPGEKLYEELKLYSEKKVKTVHKKIMILKQNQDFKPWIKLKKDILKLLFESKRLNPDGIKTELFKICPNYKPDIYLTKKLDETLYSIEGEA